MNHCVGCFRGLRICCLLICVALAASGCGDDQAREETSRGLESPASTLAQDTRQIPEPELPVSEITSSVQRDLNEVAGLIANRQIEDAQRVLTRCFIADPENVRAFELNGDLLWIANKHEEAIAAYRSMLEQGSPVPASLYRKTIDACLKSGHPFTAVEVLKLATEVYPKHSQFHYDLAGISAAIGVVEEAIPSLKTLVRHGVEDVESLVITSNPDRVKPDWKYLYGLVRSYPASEELQLGLAAIDFSNLRYRDAAEKLELLLDRQPDRDKARLLYGRCLVEIHDGERLQEWLTNLPARLHDNAAYWYIAGRWAQTRREYPQACFAFWSALQHDPTHFRAMTDLHQSLLQTDHDEIAQQVEEVVALETRLRSQLDDFFAAEQNSQRIAFSLADTLEQLGRQWEADGWARLAVRMTDDLVSEPVPRAKAIRKQLTAQTPWQKQGVSLASRIDLSSMPRMKWEFANPSSRSLNQDALRAPMLANRSLEMGYDHTSIPGLEIGKHGFWIYQALGGGVSVIDFDLDGWPDLASAVLDGEPLRRNSSTNQLHRNLGGRFVPCHTQADYHDVGFGQGIAVGDFNGDGFPDLYDTNIGEAKYFQNNGDGTFTDMTNQIGVSGSRWGTSVVIADFDADGNADIFETCYCGGTDPYSKHCGGGSDVVTCSPLKFEAELDVLWRGQDELGVRDASGQLRSVAAPGRGLGLVAGFFDEAAGMDCYVANDMSANHLWSASDGERNVLLKEQGTIRGLGLSGISKAQASMGVAAADPDRDGDIDFYVTHFTTDYNTLYEQVAPGSWVDRTVQKGLLDPTMKFLGFGTQWVDLTNQNAMQLFVANGHVNQVEESGEAFRMQPQLFGQVSGGRWKQHEGNEVGEYFQNTHLGRAVAIADLNRDQLNDLIVTHVDTPSAMLMNQTGEPGTAIRFYLKATRSHRDAIGAKVSVVRDGQVEVHQLLAGDGFLCSNERCIHIGLGEQSVAGDVTVSWPSGHVDRLGNLDAGHDFLLVENEPAFELATP